MINRIFISFTLLLVLTNACADLSNPKVLELRGITVGTPCGNIATALKNLIQKSTKPFESINCSALANKYTIRSLGITSDDKFEAISIHFTPNGVVWKVSSFTRFSEFGRPLRSDVLEALGAKFGGNPALIRPRIELQDQDVAVWSSTKNPLEGSIAYTYKYRACTGKAGGDEHDACITPQHIESGRAWMKAVQDLGGTIASTSVESSSKTPSERVIAVMIQIYDSGVGAAAGEDERLELIESGRPKIPNY